MKSRYFLSIILLLFFTLFFTTCKKDPTKNVKLPPATQEGKNTIGFTIDGEVWVPYAKCGFMGDPCRELHVSYSTLGGASQNGIGFSFTRMKNGKTSSLILSSPFATITSTGEKIDSIGITFLSENMSGNNGYFTGPLTGSKFIITKFDSSSQVISGEFQFILLEQNGSGNQLVLKDGRFDFEFNACKCSR